MIRLDDLEAKAKSCIFVSFSSEHMQQIEPPETVLALIRVVRAAQKVCATNFVSLGLLNDLDGALKEIDNA
jgi:hypothetical protein